MYRVNVIIKRPGKTDRQIVRVCSTVEERDGALALYKERNKDIPGEQMVEFYVDEITDEVIEKQP